MGARLRSPPHSVHSTRKAAWRRSQQVGGAADGRQIVWPEVVLWLSRLADIVRGEQLEPHSSGQVIHAEPGELLDRKSFSWLRETSPRTSLLSTDAAGFRHERIFADAEAIE
jgi:hypothetical protein